MESSNGQNDMNHDIGEVGGGVFDFTKREEDSKYAGNQIELIEFEVVSSVKPSDNDAAATIVIVPKADGQSNGNHHHHHLSYSNGETRAHLQLTNASSRAETDVEEVKNLPIVTRMLVSAGHLDEWIESHLIPERIMHVFPAPIDADDNNPWDLMYFCCCRSFGPVLLLLALLGCMGLGLYVFIDFVGAVYERNRSDSWPVTSCVLRNWSIECCCCGSGRALCDFPIRESSSSLYSSLRQQQQHPRHINNNNNNDSNSIKDSNVLLRCPPQYRPKFLVTVSRDNERVDLIANRYAAGEWSSLSSVTNFLNGMQPGKQYNCWYNPKNPNDIKLDPTFSPLSPLVLFVVIFMSAVCGFVFAAFVLFIVIKIRKRRHRQRFLSNLSHSPSVLITPQHSLSSPPTSPFAL